MSFQDKYQIQSALSDGESASFRAIQISSGRSVLVHHLVAGKTPPQQPDLAILIFKFLCRASDEESGKLLDMGEDEGRIYVVTPDVPECQDLRQWLQSVTGGQEAEAQPAKETAGPINLDATRGFTTEALRQALRNAGSAPAPSKEGTAGPQNLGSTRAYTTEAMREALRNAESAAKPIPLSPAATPPEVATPEKGSGASAPPPEVTADSSEVPFRRVTDFTAFWEKASPPSPAEPPAASVTPPASPESPEAPPEVPAVTAEFLSFWKSREPANIEDAPTSALPTLQAQAAAREGKPGAAGGPVEAKGGAAQASAPVLTPPAMTPTPAATVEGEISQPLPPSAAKPADPASGTMMLGGLKDVLGDSDKASPPAEVSASPPGMGQKTEEKPAAEAPRRPIPSGFEVVFQSDKPRSRSTQLGLPGQSGIMATPAVDAPPSTPPEPAPAPAAAVPPSIAPAVANPQAVSPPAGKAGGTWVMGLPNIQAEPGPAAGATNQPTAPPLSPPATPVNKELEPAAGTLIAPGAPPMPGPAGQPMATPAAPASSPPAAPDGKEPESATRFVPAAPPLPAPTPRPTSSRPGQPGEFTRMMRNVKVPAGPLAPAGTPGGASALYRSAANPAASSPTLARPASVDASAPSASPYPVAPAPLPASRYVAIDAPPLPGRRKRKSWVPVLILCSLFLMTVALLLFFAFKH